MCRGSKGRVCKPQRRMFWERSEQSVNSRERMNRGKVGLWAKGERLGVKWGRKGGGPSNGKPARRQNNRIVSQQTSQPKNKGEEEKSKEEQEKRSLKNAETGRQSGSVNGNIFKNKRSINKKPLQKERHRNGKKEKTKAFGNNQTSPPKPPK